MSEQKYKEMIHQVMELLKGKTSSLVKTLEEEMEKLSDEMKFEEAGKLIK